MRPTQGERTRPCQPEDTPKLPLRNGFTAFQEGQEARHKPYESPLERDFYCAWSTITGPGLRAPAGQNRLQEA